MSSLRLLGAVAALVGFMLAAAAYDRRRVSRRSLLILAFICAGLVALSVSPSLFDPIFDLFHFGRGNDRRLLFVLMVATVVLFLLLVRVQSQADTNERAMRLLVEALGRERFDWDRASALPEARRIVVVSPAYNEAENVADVVRAIPSELDSYQVVVVVVSDGSDDRTAERAREAGALVAELPIRRGGGLALRVGYGIALDLGAEIVVTLDADGQHLPEELAVLVGPIIADEADYVNGSRLLGDFQRESLIRHMGVHFFSRLLTVLTGRRITDPSSGYRAARSALLRKLVLEQDQFWTSEVLIEALRHRARITEVPITVAARAAGRSKKPRSLRYGWNFSKAIIQTWLR